MSSVNQLIHVRMGILLGGAGGPGEAPTGILTLEGLGFQVAIGEGGGETQGVTTDKGGDVGCGEGQGCPCDLVQQTRHLDGYSAFRACKRQEGRKWGETSHPSPIQFSHFSPHRKSKHCSLHFPQLLPTQ